MENDDEPIPSSSLRVQTSGLYVDDIENMEGGHDEEDISPFDTSTMVAQKPKTRKPIIHPHQKIGGFRTSHETITTQNLDIAPKAQRYFMYQRVDEYIFEHVIPRADDRSHCHILKFISQELGR